MNIHVHRDRGVGDFEAWGLPAWNFEEFHREELPRRLEAGAREQVAWDVAGARPFAIVLTDGRAYSYIAADGTVRLEPGIQDDAVCVIELEENVWRNYVHGLRTPSALVLSEAVRILRGGMAEWDIWHPAIECLYTGRPIYNPNEPLLDRNGQPLDLHRKFTMQDDPEVMSHFLRTAGYLVIRGAMAHRRDEISAEIDRVRDAEREGGIFSWWVDNKTTGERFPYRLLFISEQSELVRSLMDEDPVVKKLTNLAGVDLVPLHDRGQGAMTVLKPFKAGEEIAQSIAGNLGWHTDCGLGGCSIMCPSINIGIHLDRAGPNSSRLWMLAGTNGRVAHGAAKSASTDSPRAIALDTEPGDVSIHYSCTLHAGPPPTGNESRRTLYLPFYSPETLRLLGRFQSFEQILPGYGTGDIPSLYDVAEQLTVKA